MPLSLIQPLFSIPIACIDVETTGASADYGDRIIEIGIVRYDNGLKTAEYQQLIDPRRRISPGVSALTGITQSMCDGQPTFQPAASRDAAASCRSGHPRPQHPIRPLIPPSRMRRRPASISAGRSKTPTFSTPSGSPDADSAAAATAWRPSPAGSATIHAIVHRALPDALTTAIVFELLLSSVGGWNICLCDALKEQGGPMGLAPASPRENPLPLELQEALDQRRPVMMEYLDANQNAHPAHHRSHPDPPRWR